MECVICDRCGKKLIVRNGREHLHVTCYNSRGAHGVLKKILGYKEKYIDFDLCDDCTRELQEWLHVEN